MQIEAPRGGMKSERAATSRVAPLMKHLIDLIAPDVATSETHHGERKMLPLQSFRSLLAAFSAFL